MPPEPFSLAAGPTGLRVRARPQPHPFRKRAREVIAGLLADRGKAARREDPGSPGPGRIVATASPEAPPARSAVPVREAGAKVQLRPLFERVADLRDPSVHAAQTAAEHLAAALRAEKEARIAAGGNELRKAQHLKRAAAALQQQGVRLETTDVLAAAGYLRRQPGLLPEREFSDELSETTKARYFRPWARIYRRWMDTDVAAALWGMLTNAAPVPDGETSHGHHRRARHGGYEGRS